MLTGWRPSFTNPSRREEDEGNPLKEVFRWAVRMAETTSRSSSREVSIWVLVFSVVYVSRGTLPQKRVKGL